MIVFDIDGTIADMRHRLHYIQTIPKDYDAFYDAVFDDEPIWPVITVLKALYKDGHDIVLLTGRNETCRVLTELWLLRYDIPCEELYMRKKRDRRPDYVIKKEIMDNEIIPRFGKPDMIFEDRKRVIDMWNSEGYNVIAVGDGDY